MRCFRYTILAICLVFSMNAWTQTAAEKSILDELLQSPAHDTTHVMKLCDAAWERKDFQDGSPLLLLNKAVTLSNELDYKKGKGLALSQKGTYYRERGQFGLAESFFRQSLTVRKLDGDYLGMAKSCNNLGMLKREQADLLSAKFYFEKAVQLASSAGDSNEVARISNGLSMTLKAMGDYELGMKYAYRSLQIREHVQEPDSLEIGRSHLAVGVLQEVMGHVEPAAVSYLKALACFKAASNVRDQAKAMHNIGNLAEVTGDRELAMTYYKLSLSAKYAAGDTIGASSTLRVMGRIYLMKLDSANCVKYLQQARKIATTYNNEVEQILIDLDFAELKLWTGNPQATIDELERILPIMDSISEVPHRIYAIYLLSLAYAANDNWDSSMRYHVKGLNLRNQLDQEANKTFYLTQKYQEEETKNEKLQGEINVAHERARFYWTLIIALSIILIALTMFGFQRVYTIQSRKKAEIAELELEKKANEIDNLLQVQELKSLQNTLEGENRERSRIAHDLHDRVGGQLATFKMLFGQLMEEIANSNPQFFDRCQSMKTSLENTISEVRAVSHNLESPTLRDFGLVAALEGVRDSVVDAQGLEFELDTHDMDQRLPYNTEMQIFLVIGELLNNAVKNGKAKSFSVQLLRNGNMLSIVVEDSGIGFNPNDPSKKKGIGLRSISDRIKSLNGTHKIDSAIGRGTIVTIEIPL
jgi:two-component system, NarL family, sensor kinase